MKIKQIWVAMLLVTLTITPIVMAQDGGTATGRMTPQLVGAINIAIGFVISLAVSWLKNISFIQANPKKAALGLSVFGSILVAYFAPEAGAAWLTILLSVLEQLAAAIGTFEIVTKTVKGESNG
jgi:hypothetical protein